MLKPTSSWHPSERYNLILTNSVTFEENDPYEIYLCGSYFSFMKHQVIVVKNKSSTYSFGFYERELNTEFNESKDKFISLESPDFTLGYSSSSNSNCTQIISDNLTSDQAIRLNTLISKFIGVKNSNFNDFQNLEILNGETHFKESEFPIYFGFNRDYSYGIRKNNCSNLWSQIFHNINKYFKCVKKIASSTTAYGVSLKIGRKKRKKIQKNKTTKKRKKLIKST